MPKTAKSNTERTEMKKSAASVSYNMKKIYLSRSVVVFLHILCMCLLTLVVDCLKPQVTKTANNHHTTQAPSTTEAAMLDGNSTVSLSSNTKVTDVRLPASLRPFHYQLQLQPFIRGNFSINGYVQVEVEVVTETSVFTLHMADIITHNETVKIVDTRSAMEISILKQTYDNQRQFYHAHLQQPLTKGRRYVLSMEFTGYLNDHLRGFYRSSYTDSNGIKRWLAVTKFQPTDARRAFPCFDEPAMKATFEVFLAREKDMFAISNMPKINSRPIEGQQGWMWDHFNTTVPMSTYLTAFLVSDFSSKEVTTQNGVSFRTWARETAINQANYSLEIGSKILTFFEDYFSIPYPLPKQDMVAIPDFAAGAMENWGLITYRETAMLYDPKVSSAYNKQWVATVVAHELAHQWFGNLVTPKWWTDLWLNEGFASFIEYVGADHAEPEWQMMEQFIMIDLHKAFRLDCLESSHPISIPVAHPDEIYEIFDTISYAKGASIIRMMKFFLTEATFRRGLTNYLKTKAYANAEQDDLWDFLTQAAHQDLTLGKCVTVKTIMDTWTLQMGYPVITVMRSADGASATVTQERFLLSKDANSNDTHVYRWWVPLSHTTQATADFSRTAPSRWLSKTDSKITIRSLPDSSQWVIFNVQETGYYRVNYDENNWKQLIKQLKADHTKIHVNNRAQLIDDALNLAQAGQLSYSLPMELIAYLKSETSYTPWATALNNLAYIDKVFSRTGTYGSLKNFLLHLLEPQYESIGFRDSLTDPHLVQHKRVKILSWACKLGHEDCVNQSVGLFNQWMMNPLNKSIISPNLKDVVYCTAIAAGKDKEWEFAWNQYLNSNVGSEKSRLLSALGCSRELWILSRYLEMAFTKDTGIRKQDVVRVFYSVASNIVGQDLAWTFLRDQLDDIIDYMGRGFSSLKWMIKGTTNGMNKDLYLTELKQFQSANKDKLGSVKQAVSQAIETVANNIEWMNKNRQVITEWLENHGYLLTLRST
ncbi:aminopeptidase N-like [Scylla paramamosain]|uniref:aminopeptidase N-like n=1 Tax=Scylla paramamosain TaxID=85552 RepID=UPI0030833D84